MTSAVNLCCAEAVCVPAVFPAAAAVSDAVDIPELPPNDRMVRKLADAEHKACRSLMHRWASGN